MLKLLSFLDSMQGQSANKRYIMTDNKEMKEPASTYPRLTLREKLGLPLRILLFGPVLGLNLVRCLSLACWRKLPLHYYAFCALIRTTLGTFTPRQLQYLQGGSRHSYRTWIKWARSSIITNPKDPRPEERLKEDIQVLPDGESSLMWIGNRQKATTVVLFFHGGGYVVPISWGQMEWCLRGFVQGSDRADVAVACLQYGLAPNLQFPGQLRQAADALNHLLRSGIEPSHIILGGDSCGGNLTFELLAHMLHPRPGLEPVDDLSKPLLGVFAVSPWVSNIPNTPSWYENNGIDAISPGIIFEFGRNLLDKSHSGKEGWEGNTWAFPSDADPTGSWFDGLHKVTDSLYVTVGKHEVLRDDIVFWVEAVRRRNPEAEVIIKVYQDLGHDFLLVEGMSKTYGQATEDMKAWVSKLLAS